MPTKSIFQSKTFWFNTITIALALADALAQTELIGPEALTMVVAIGNIALRTVTSTPVTVAGQSLNKTYTFEEVEKTLE